jgi:diguanylate cyclase (GGDEF)-like protein
MQVTNKNYKSLDDLEHNLDLSKFDAKNTLIQVFSGLVTEREVTRIQSIIKRECGGITFIGTTTAGEIHHGEVFKNSISMSMMEFESTYFDSYYFHSDNDYELGRNIAKTSFKNDTKVVITFIDGLLTNGNDVIDGISSINPNIPIAGGMAAENGSLKNTFLFNNDGVYRKGAVAVSLNSDILKVFTDYQLNWQPIGKFMTVTKAESNHIYEIDDISVSDIYKKYLGSVVGEGLPHSATEFPLLKIEDDGVEVCRIFSHKFEDDGSLLAIGNLKVGDKVRLAFGNVNLIVEKAKKNIHDYPLLQLEAIFAYSCASRIAFLQSDIIHELEPLNKVAPLSGFFTFGEIFHKNAKNNFLNVSLTILGLSENANEQVLHSQHKSTVKEEEKNFFTNKHFIVLDALTNLSNTVIEELNNANKKLEEVQNKLTEQANHDYLTNLYNRRYFNEVAQGFLQVAKREGNNFSVMMLDIDKFKVINDTYGHLIGDEVIKALSAILIGNTRSADIVSRFGGEEFAILLPSTDTQGSFEIAEKLRRIVQHHRVRIENHNIKFTISIGISSINHHNDKHITEALDRADKALYEAKENGRNGTVIF